MLDFKISADTSVSPILKMTLENSIGQQILDIGNSGLIDNETFQENFGFFFLNEYSLIGNTIIYLNPQDLIVNLKFIIIMMTPILYI